MIIFRIYLPPFVQPSVDINIKNNRNHTPLHCTSIEGHGTIIEALVGYGADLNAADTEGNTALHIILIKKVGMPPNEDLTPQIMKVSVKVMDN